MVWWGGVRDRVDSVGGGGGGGFCTGRIQMVDSSTHTHYTHHGPCRMNLHTIVHHHSSLGAQGLPYTTPPTHTPSHLIG